MTEARDTDARTQLALARIAQVAGNMGILLYRLREQGDAFDQKQIAAGIADVQNGIAALIRGVERPPTS